MIRKWLCRLLGCHGRGRFGWQISEPKPKHTMLELKITNEQKISVKLTPRTATGKPAELDGKATFTIVSGESSVLPGEDGRSATLVSSDAPGDTQFLVEADADLGEGVETISDIIKLTVIGAHAANLGLEAGNPEPK